MSDCGVAVLRMAAVSVISTIKVERPRARLSLAPMRVKMRSTTLMCAARAGTNDPICAMMTMSAACRRYVLLPPMFGPVRTDRVAGRIQIKVVGNEAVLRAGQLGAFD